MDTERFKLTGYERIEIWETYKKEHSDPELIVDSEFGYINRLLQAQVAKVFSMLEPVELEALGNEELYGIAADYQKEILETGEIGKLVKAVQRATLQHNWGKGQLYRVKEVIK